MLTASSWVCSCPKTDLMAEVAEAIFCLSFITNKVETRKNKIVLENGHYKYIETCFNSHGNPAIARSPLLGVHLAVHKDNQVKGEENSWTMLKSADLTCCTLHKYRRNNSCSIVCQESLMSYL